MYVVLYAHPCVLRYNGYIYTYNNIKKMQYKLVKVSYFCKVNISTCIEM